MDIETASSLSAGQTVCDIWGQSRLPKNCTVCMVRGRGCSGGAHGLLSLLPGQLGGEIIAVLLGVWAAVQQQAGRNVSCGAVTRGVTAYQTTLALPPPRSSFLAVV